MEDRLILIIEDERELAEILRDYLAVEGFKAILAFDGEEGLRAFETVHPGFVLLDIMLPKMDGIEVCKRIRIQSDVPILMLSAKSGEMDKVISLGIGADDYVTKPFSPLELVARVKAHLRRYRSQEPKENTSRTLIVGKLKLSKDYYEVLYEDKKLEFTTKEFDMLYFFGNHLNLVFSKEQIYEQIWGMNEYGDISSVATYIKRIRNKLDEYGLDYIRTVWGVGYKMTV
ncbi:MAG: yycF 1 [Herbinix sp.]|jgi:DNA-binding response OmpR family regulator|nr:yycF 1 [Herbinix sp.]